jgi:hypothetical protein
MAHPEALPTRYCHCCDHPVSPPTQPAQECPRLSFVSWLAKEIAAITDDGISSENNGPRIARCNRLRFRPRQCTRYAFRPSRLFWHWLSKIGRRDLKGQPEQRKQLSSPRRCRSKNKGGHDSANSNVATDSM